MYSIKDRYKEDVISETVIANLITTILIGGLTLILVFSEGLEVNFFKVICIFLGIFITQFSYYNIKHLIKYNKYNKNMSEFIISKENKNINDTFTDMYYLEKKLTRFSNIEKVSFLYDLNIISSQENNVKLYYLLRNNKRFMQTLLTSNSDLDWDIGKELVKKQYEILLDILTEEDLLEDFTFISNYSAKVELKELITALINTEYVQTTIDSYELLGKKESQQKEIDLVRNI